jgi:CDP-2,3-bis-(O-geranylgeranyl)-sn-glycerol synthase
VKSRTIREVIAAVVTTAIGGTLIGYPIQIGVLFSAASLSGDPVSVFIERRLNFPPSGRALGPDPLPESIPPLLFCRQALEADMPTVVTVVFIFTLRRFFLPRLLYR